MLKSIDVIVPSFRVQKEYILPIIQLIRPEGVTVRFYIIVDNPAISINEELLQAVDDNEVYLIINKNNLGASLTRNKGIDSGSGDWILFLDDDIKIEPNLLCIYRDAINRNPEEIGFIGLVNLPPADSAFTKATMASGSADIFSIASVKDSYTWGATANIAIKREALGPIRFNEAYPKGGGGEDVDFFLRFRARNNFKNLKTLAEAQVWHPWWNNGEPNFKRSYRYGNGAAFLMHLHPQYTRYDFPTTPESLFFLLIGLAVSGLFFPEYLDTIGIAIPGVILIEAIASYFYLRRSYRKPSIAMIYYSATMKIYYDSGVLFKNLSQGFWTGLFRHFNYSGIRKKNHFIQFNRYKLVKLILFVFLVICLIW